MTRATQKARERTYVEWLQRECPQIQRLTFQDSEVPDFVGAGLGIEVTEFHRESGPRGSLAMLRERDRKRILVLAEAKYVERGGPRRLVHVALTYGMIPEAQHGVVASGIAEYVLEHAIAPTTAHKADLPTAIRPFVRWITIAQIGNVARWDGSAQTIVLGGETAEIQRAIRRKEDRLPVARNQASSIWLLIVAPGELLVDGGADIAASSMIPDLPELAEQTWTTEFDRIYLGEYVTRRLYRLRTSPLHDAQPGGLNATP